MWPWTRYSTALGLNVFALLSLITVPGTLHAHQGAELYGFHFNKGGCYRVAAACFSNGEDSKSFARKSFCSWKNSSKAPFGYVDVG